MRTVSCILVPALVAALSSLSAADVPFARGDANADGVADLSDGLCILLHLFGGGGSCAEPACLDALDSDDDGALAVTDAVYLLAHLFQGAPPPPAPVGPACGLDPTADSLGCEASPSCASGRFIEVVIPRDLDLYSLWSEARSHVADVQEALARVRLAEGRHRLPLDAGTPDLDLADSLLAGPDLAEALPLGPGAVSFRPSEFFTHEYRRTFRAVARDLTLVLRFRPDGRPVETFDCARLDGVAAGGELAFFLEYTEGAALRLIHLSCFHDDAWMAARQSPWTIVLEDGARVVYALEDAYLFRGVAGETSNRRLVSATVTRAESTVDVTGHALLIYSARHHNALQEHRILFDQPLGDAWGIDVLECLPTQEPSFCLRPTPEETRAHWLGADLSRGPELRAVEVRPGGESGGGE